MTTGASTEERREITYNHIYRLALPLAIGAGLFLLPTPTHGEDLSPTPTPTATSGVDDLVPWEVNCDNEDRSDGYRMPSWAKDFCVPGEVTWEAWMCGSPGSFTGVMSSYAEGVMERVAEGFGVVDGNWRRAGYKGGVALMSCEDIGRTVSLKLPGRDKEGPFLVVDCSQRKHMFYHVVHMGLAVEVDHQTTKRWGTRVASYIEVNNGGVSYRSWWMKHCMAFDEPEWWPPIPTPSPTVTPTQTPIPTQTDLPTPTVYATVVSTSAPVELQSNEERNEMFDLLSQEQIIVIATALIIQGIKIVWVGFLKKPKPSKGHTRLLVFVVSIPIGLAIGGFGVPELGEDPMQFAIALVTMAGEVLMFGHIFYEAILSGVLGWLDKGRAILAP